MKRIIYALLITFSSSLVFMACTEEEVVPSAADNGGTYPSDPVK